MTEGMGFDGSSIEGFARIEESDMIAKPDPTTFQLIPWRGGERPVARMFCDILNPDGTPYEGDPRYVFKRVLKKVADKGYTFFIGPELEYFYFKDNKNHRAWTLAAISMHGRWTWGATSGGTRFSPFSPWESTWNTAITKWRPASTKLISAMTRGCAWPTMTMTYRLVVKEIARSMGCMRPSCPNRSSAERKRHACSPVPFQGRKECLL